MRKGLLILGLTFFMFTFTHVSYADRGSIPFHPGVKIFEPKQRAMLAWNGEEEILLLSTDLKASRPTKVLEVIPLPAEPTVKKGDVEVFRKATHIINRKLREQYRPTRGRVLSKGRESIPAGEVTFHKKIGAHDVSVTHVLNHKGFISWVEEYLKSAGVEQPLIPEPLKKVVGEYLEDGFSWFVFDVVSLDEETKTSEAIQYRFASRALFYPLRIMRTEEGDTTIDLLVLTPKLLSRFPGLPIKRINLAHKPVNINRKELLFLSEEMGELFPRIKELKLRIWQIEGKLSSFSEDLIAR